MINKLDASFRQKEWEKIKTSTLYYNVFREILNEKNTYFQIINNLNISSPSVSESLNALELFDIIERKTETNSKDKRTINISLNSKGLGRIFEKWLIAENISAQKDYVFPAELLLSDKLLNFAKKCSGVSMIKNFEILFIAYLFSSVSEVWFSKWTMKKK